jgi:hypothetical protein
MLSQFYCKYGLQIFSDVVDGHRRSAHHLIQKKFIISFKYRFRQPLLSCYIHSSTGAGAQDLGLCCDWQGGPQLQDFVSNSGN